MSKHPRVKEAKARWLALTIALPVIAYGAYLVAEGYAPATHTRFGYTQPLFGNDARGYGLIVMLTGCLPLLLLCRTSRQALLFGTSLGVVLLIAIFALAYS